VNFDIQPSSAEPIYRQIVEQLRRWVASGQVRAGDELPSVRALAQEHAINPMTVSKAYSLLEADGLLERRRGMGMVVADVRPASRPAQRLVLLRPALQAAAQQAAQLGLGLGECVDEFKRALQAQGLADKSKPTSKDKVS
jgi:GntR family transcriptional regulator